VETDRRSRSRSRDRKDEAKKLKWIRQGIVVRVVNKKVEGGSLYTHKFKVTDVISRF
jgi:hypothetical protein